MHACTFKNQSVCMSAQLEKQKHKITLYYTILRRKINACACLHFKKSKHVHVCRI
jgi:hypothetical protein